MTHHVFRIVLGGLVVALALASCSSGPGTGRGPDGVLRVEGTYTGKGTYLLSDLGTRFEVSIRMIVVQSGSDVTLSGSMTSGDTTINLPANSGTLSSTGVYTPTSRGVVDYEAAVETSLCGTIHPISASLAFSGNRAIWEESADTDYCGRIHFSATLTR